MTDAKRTKIPYSDAIYLRNIKANFTALYGLSLYPVSLSISDGYSNYFSLITGWYS